jgi:hypothetical protein
MRVGYGVQALRSLASAASGKRCLAGKPRAARKVAAAQPGLPRGSPAHVNGDAAANPDAGRRSRDLDEARAIRRARIALHRSQRRRGFPWLLPGGALGGCDPCRQERNGEREEDPSHRRFLPRSACAWKARTTALPRLTDPAPARPPAVRHIFLDIHTCVYMNIRISYRLAGSHVDLHGAGDR